MRENKISIGDNVRVQWPAIPGCHARGISGTVSWIPVATGDSWVIVEDHTEDIYYISEPVTIIKYSEKGQSKNDQ